MTKTVIDAKTRLALIAWLTNGLTEESANGKELKEAMSSLGESWQN